MGYCLCDFNGLTIYHGATIGIKLRLDQASTGKPLWIHGRNAEQMATKQQWIEFVKALRAQDELRTEARPFEEGKIFIRLPLPGSLQGDVNMTNAHIASIKGEIANLENAA